jgi:hypothetical protein
MYAYDQRPLNETVERVEDERPWRKDTLLFAALPLWVVTRRANLL